MDCIILVDETTQQKDPTQYTAHTHASRYYFQHGFGFIFLPRSLRVVSIIFHTFYFDYYSYLCTQNRRFSHGTGSLPFVLFSHVGLLSFIQDSLKRSYARCERECLSVYTRIHATWYWISRIYLFLHSFHLSAFLHIFAKRFGSIQLIFMCFAFCCFWLYNWLALLFSFIFMATTFVFTDVCCTLLLSCNDDACKFICGFSCWNSRWF